MGAWTAATVGSNLMFAQRKQFFANINESSKFTKLIKNVGTADVQSEGDMFYVWGDVVTAKGFATRPFTSETMSRPTAYPPTLAIAKWQCYDWWHPFQISGKLAMQGQMISKLDALSTYMKVTAEEIAFHRELILTGNHNGILGKVKGTTSSSTSLVVEDASKFRVGQYIDQIATATTAYGSASPVDVLITAVNLKTNTLTTASNSFTDGYYLTMQDSAQLYPMGLMDLVNDGTTYTQDSVEVILGQTTYAGLTKSSTQGWNSYIEQVTGALTEKAWNNFLANAVGFYNDNEIPWTHALVNPKTFGYMKSILAPNFRTMSSTDATIRLGALGVELWIPESAQKTFGVIPCGRIPPKCIVFITAPDIGIRYPQEPSWRRPNGQILQENTNETAGTFTFTGSFIGIETLIGHPHMHGALIFSTASA